MSKCEYTRILSFFKDILSFTNFSCCRRYAFQVWLARAIVVFVCESWLPILHVLVAYPMAGMFGRIGACFQISFFLMMNNLCYVAIGSFLGAITSNVSIGMIVSTLVSQTSLLAAGFYTTLPPVINLLRYISPVTYTYTGILKTAFRTTDTFKCMRGGQSDIGANQCYIEQSMGIDILKRRGINVATFNDPSTSSVLSEVLVLCCLYIVLNIAVLAILTLSIRHRKEGDTDMMNDEDKEFAHSLNMKSMRISTMGQGPSSIRTSSLAHSVSLGLQKANHLDMSFVLDAMRTSEGYNSSQRTNGRNEKLSNRHNDFEAVAEEDEKEWENDDGLSIDSDEVGSMEFLPEKKKVSVYK
jgi:hypothetical protein